MSTYMEEEQRRTDELIARSEARNLELYGFRYVTHSVPVYDRPIGPKLPSVEFVWRSRDEVNREFSEHCKTLPKCSDAELEEWVRKNSVR